jgi:hypothetical protein
MAETKKSRFVRNYYTVNVPGDAFGTLEEVTDYAINEARERAKLYCIPCEWTARVVSGELGDFEIEVRVCRKRNRK